VQGGKVIILTRVQPMTCRELKEVKGKYDHQVELFLEFSMITAFDCTWENLNLSSLIL
jgi:hypothetical protein